jgi:hypothetical protein
MKSKVLNLIAYVHILVPHLERRLNQICSGYSWPTDFSTIQSEMDDEFSISYLLEKSNKYLGIDLLVDYDRTYEIDTTDTSMFSEKSVSPNPIKVRGLKDITDYFIEIGKFDKIHDIGMVEPETYFTFPDGREAELINSLFKVHGADPWVTSKIKEYYEEFICSRTWHEDKDYSKSTWIKDDKLTQIERDLKLRSILSPRASDT